MDWFLYEHDLRHERVKVCQMLCAIWYHLFNFKKVKNTHGGMTLLVKLQTYFTESNAPLWVFFMFFKLY